VFVAIPISLQLMQGEELDQWMYTTFHNGIPELRPFVNKLRQDQATMQAGLILR